MYQPQAVPDARRFESALEPAAAAAAAFEETLSLAEAAAEARRQLLDNVNFANEYERKRQQQLAALPDAERALTKNYLERLDPAEGSWTHDHARKIRYGFMNSRVDPRLHASVCECLCVSAIIYVRVRLSMFVCDCLRVSMNVSAHGCVFNSVKTPRCVGQVRYREGALSICRQRAEGDALDDLLLGG